MPARTPGLVGPVPTLGQRPSRLHSLAELVERLVVSALEATGLLAAQRQPTSAEGEQAVVVVEVD